MTARNELWLAKATHFLSTFHSRLGEDENCVSPNQAILPKITPTGGNVQLTPRGMPLYVLRNWKLHEKAAVAITTDNGGDLVKVVQLEEVAEEAALWPST